ncbi:MAG: hypothetical protein IKQ20_11890 [Bacteroidales bacterium]|nr:hypothetical protein [Bacteroidales bacterium]
MQADPNYRNFVLSGDSTRVSVYVSMLYLIQSVANSYAESAIALMEKHNLVHKKIKITANNLSQSFDAFDKCLFALVNKQNTQNIFCGDFERFQDICDHFMNIEGAIKRFNEQNQSNHNNENLPDNENLQQD